MVQTFNQRVAAKIEGDFVVFLIGARINRWWKFLSFIPIARAMTRMVGELEANRDYGLLHVEMWSGMRASAVQTTVKSHCSLNILRAATMGNTELCQALWGPEKGLPSIFGLAQGGRAREIARSGASVRGARGEGEIATVHHHGGVRRQARNTDKYLRNETTASNTLCAQPSPSQPHRLS